MDRWVEIAFDCLPLRSVGRIDIPLDASPKFRALCEQILQAIHKHGAFNSYFLYNAHCRYHLANSADLGMLEFRFAGTLLTNATDDKAETADLHAELACETCDWLTEPVVQWFQQSVSRSVIVEFDRYIAAGDLAKAKRRMEQIQAASDEAGGYLGMFL